MTEPPELSDDELDELIGEIRVTPEELGLSRPRIDSDGSADDIGIDLAIAIKHRPGCVVLSNAAILELAWHLLDLNARSQ